MFCRSCIGWRKIYVYIYIYMFFYFFFQSVHNVFILISHITGTVINFLINFDKYTIDDV